MLTVKSKLRDGEWDNQFLDALRVGQIRVLTQDPQTGPEGFPYLLTTTYGEEGKEPFEQIANWCAETGVGMVLNPTEDGEDYMFTFGMLWNLKYRGEFYSFWMHDDSQPSSDEMVVRKITDVFWPEKPRRIFKEFLAQQNIFNAKVVLFSKDAKSDPELGISLESLGSPHEREHAGILEAFSWFFPRHYTLVLVPETQLGKQHFVSV